MPPPYELSDKVIIYINDAPCVYLLTIQCFQSLTVAHWYNYERFVAFSPPASLSDFGVDDGAFIPDESTVVVPENTVSIILFKFISKTQPFYY